MEKTQTIGQKISPILIEIENALWEFEANVALPPQFTTEGFRAANKIFMAAIMDKLWLIQEFDKMPIKDCENMAENLGKEIKDIVFKYTNIDTHKLYK